MLPIRRRSVVAAALMALTLAVAGAPGLPTQPAHAAGYVVDTLADSGPGSLRQAILDANAAAGADTITFSVSGTITLAAALPDITDPAGLTIDGGGQSVTVSGNNAVRPFQVAAAGSLDMRFVMVTSGRAVSEGGGIANRGTMRLHGSTVADNTVEGTCGGLGCGGGFGGGVSNGGHLTVTSSTITRNVAIGVCDRFACQGGAGGGIYSGSFLGSSTLSISNSTVSENQASGYRQFVNNGSGGGIYILLGTATISSSTVGGNSVGSSAAGGGVAGSATLVNSIVAGNTAKGAPDCSDDILTLGPKLYWRSLRVFNQWIGSADRESHDWSAGG